MQYIIEGLNENKTLKGLGLSKLNNLNIVANNITDRGANGISKIIASNSPLLILDLSKFISILETNNIGDDGAIQIGDALKGNSKLIMLSLGIIVKN